ncbi:hypothetical protein PANI_CDS0057 [Maribacter phage Panino]
MNKFKDFSDFVGKKHPDPDSLLMQDNFGEKNSLRIGYESEQINRLAESYAEYKIIEYRKKKMIEKGLNSA